MKERRSPLPVAKFGLLLAFPIAVLLIVGTVGRDTSTTIPGLASSPIDTAEGSQITIQDFAFQPTNATISIGETVTWSNTDNVEHSIIDSGIAFQADPFDSGESFRHTYDKAGEYSYFCGIHGSMTGTVIVTE